MTQHRSHVKNYSVAEWGNDQDHMVTFSGEHAKRFLGSNKCVFVIDAQDEFKFGI